MSERAGFSPAPVPAADPLAASVLAELADLPGGDDVPGHRAAVLGRTGKLAVAMRRAEVGFRRGAVAPRMLAELWMWVGYLAAVRGYTADTTVAQYARSVCRFLEFATDRGLDFAQAKARDFDGWQKWLAVELRHGPRWRGRQVAAVKGFYHWRTTRGLGENVAASDLRGPREPLGMARKYTTGQLKSLLAATQARRIPAMRLRDAALLLFLLSTGARREEASRLSLRDLHLGQRSGLVRLHGKGAKEREVPFEGPVVDMLRQWLLQREQVEFTLEDDAVFVGLSGIGRGARMRPRAIERVVAVAAREAGLREWGVHRFRVTFATTLYDDGAGIEEIRTLMGHESIETTRRYLAVSERTRRTRLSADRQHEVLGTRNTGQPRWLRAALGGVKG